MTFDSLLSPSPHILNQMTTRPPPYLSQQQQIILSFKRTSHLTYLTALLSRLLNYLPSPNRLTRFT